MAAQRFLAEFGHIANAPGGVARLRELVFHLAVVRFHHFKSKAELRTR